jgi:choline dehydrogenase-like flavoprotein
VLHNLGGCSRGKDRNNGVINSFGQVYKENSLSLTETYNNFYIVDGGIMPSSIRVNSSLTISALPFRIAEHIVGHSNLSIKKITIGTKIFYFFDIFVTGNSKIVIY